MRKRSIITIVIVCTVVAGAVIAWAKLADSQSNNNQAKTPTDEERILAIDPDFSNWKVENSDLEKIPNLTGVCLQTTSFSWIDIDFLKNKNIPVMNLRGFSSEAVAEWAFLMALNVARKIPLVSQKGWKYN